MTAPITVTIDGTPVSVQTSRFKIEDRLLGRSVCSMTVNDKTASLALLGGMAIEVYDSTPTLVFAGFLAEDPKVSPIVADGSAREWDLDCVDNHYRADKVIVAASWENSTVGDIVADLVADWLAAEGVTIGAGTVTTGPVITRAVFNYIPASQALDRLAELANCWWRIDHQAVLHLQPRTEYAAPWALTTADIMWRGATAEQGQLEYRNVQYVKGGQDLTDIQLEQFVGDGDRRTFSVGYPIAKVPTITVNIAGGGWAAQTVGIKGVDTGKDWYWSGGDPEVQQDDAGTELTAADKLRVSYQGRFPVVTLSIDQAQVVGRAALDGTTGRVEAVVHETQIGSRAEGFEMGAALLDRYSHTGRVVKFDTRRSGLEPGMLLTATVPALDLAGAELLIEKVTVTVDGADPSLLRWAVEGTEGPASQTWAEWFAHAYLTDVIVALEDISEEEVLALLTTTDETWTWNESVSETIFSCPVPSAALYPLSTLYPC